VGVRRIHEQGDQPTTSDDADRSRNADAVQTVLVVGGAGYIGSTMVRGLLGDGYRVRVLDSLEFGDASIRALYNNPDFEVVRGDFRCVEPVVRATQGVDAVIHLGGIVGDPACAVDEDLTLETNLAATSLLTEVCRGAGISRLLFASSCSVYGMADEIVDEQAELNPVSLYAATKADSEKVLLEARNQALHPVIFRLATVFGWSYRPRFDLVVNLLTARAMSEGKITIFNGEQWRPFIHVEDVCRAFRMALVAPLDLVSGQVFNAGSSFMNFTLRQLADTIEHMEPGLEVEYVDNEDKRNYRVSFERIRRELGFQCHVGLETGVRGLQEALRRGLVKDYTEPVYNNYKTLLAQITHANGHQAEPEADLLARQFSQKSIWWNLNHSNGSGHTNGRSASNGQGVKPVANSGSSPRVVAAGG
jgi:nucleoside-diphosphate-sugar epimerase